MLTFLEINGLAVDAPDTELAKWILSLSAGATPRELADLIRSRSRAIG
jgi:prophage maintenance system killer protein